MAEDKQLIDSASILVVRDNEKTNRLEVLMVRRHNDIDFAGGSYVFPGGKTDPTDIVDEAMTKKFQHGYGELLTTAIREVYEESGLIIGDPEKTEPYRDALTNGKISVSDMIKQTGVACFARHVYPFARWVTPRIYPKRFDTRFFITRAPKNQIAIPDEYEIVETVWVEPIDFIEKRSNDMMFPTIMNLKLLGQSNSVEGAIAKARQRKIMTVEPKIIDGRRIIDPDAGYGEIDQENISSGIK